LEKITGKTIYVFGAGASQHSGAPLLRDFLVTARLLLESNPNLKHKNSFIKVFDWIDKLRGSSYYIEFDLDNLEHIFSLCEMLKQVGDTEGKELSSNLNYLVMETLDRKCQLEWRKDQFLPNPQYKEFIDCLRFINDQRRTTLGKPEGEFERDLIITFNYDVMLDYAMWFVNLMPEYCLFPPPYRNNGYRLLKLHGSINWAMCRECVKKNLKSTIQVVRPNPMPPNAMTPPYVSDGTLFELRMMTEVLPNTPCVSCNAQNMLEPFIIPPTWSKAVGNTPLAPVWEAAVKEIKTAFQIIVVGYSMPATDTFFQYLLTLGLAQNSRLNRVVIVDKDPSPSLQERYAKVFARSLNDRGRLQFITGITFAQFVSERMRPIGSQVG